jgi:hypothetical protein
MGVIAAVAIIKTWSVDLQSIVLMSLYILALGVLAQTATTLINNQTTKMVLSWFILISVMLFIFVFFLSSIFPGKLGIAPSYCLVRFWEKCVDVSEDVTSKVSGKVAPASSAQSVLASLTGEYRGEGGILDQPVPDLFFLSINVSNSGDLTGALSNGTMQFPISGKVSGNHIRFSFRMSLQEVKKEFGYEYLPKGLENAEISIVWYGDISEKLISGKWKMNIDNIKYGQLSPQDKVELSKATMNLNELGSRTYWRLYR